MCRCGKANGTTKGNSDLNSRKVTIHYIEEPETEARVGLDIELPPMQRGHVASRFSHRMMWLIICGGILLLSPPSGRAQSTQALPQPLLLWPSGAPLAQGTAPSDQPQIIPYIPLRPTTRTGIVVVPGGGYGAISMPTEGVQVAQFLNAAGIPAFVLKYRVGPQYRYPVQLQDGQRAIRYVRSHAAEYHLDKIGVMGFSAGGHLASELGVSFDSGKPEDADAIERVSSRPDFMVLGYAVIAPTGSASTSSFQNILGKNLDPKMVAALSTDLHVTPQTPPTFLVCADDDKSVSPEDSVRFYLALHRAGVPAELHIYEHGKHAFSMGVNNPFVGTWTIHLFDWLRINGFVEGNPH